MFPIVLIHGFPLDSTMWQAQASYLRSPAGGGHTVHVPDLPGFGEAAGAAPNPELATIEDYARHIHQYIHRHCGGKAIVAGFSMGGYVLLALLRDFLTDAAAAMFIDTRAEGDSAEARATRLKSIEDMQKNGPAGLFDSMTPRLLSKHPTAEVKQQVRAIMDRQQAPGLIAAQRAMARRRDQSDLLPQLQLPVLVMVGAEDAMTPPSVALAMQSHMPHAMAAQIVGAGHLSPMEQPDAVNGTLKSFLATVPR